MKFIIQIYNIFFQTFFQTFFLKYYFNIMGKKKGRSGIKKNTNKNNYKINKRIKTMKIGKKINEKNKKKINKMISNYSSLNVNDELLEIERKRLEGQILTAINTAKLYKKDKLTFLAATAAMFSPFTTDKTGSMVSSLEHRRPVGTPQNIFVYNTPSLNPQSKKNKSRKKRREELRQKLKKKIQSIKKARRKKL